jgi:hypothetical protein
VTTVAELPTLGALREEQRGLKAQIASLRRRLRLELGLEVAAATAVVLAATAALLVFLDWWLRFGLSTRLVVLALSLTGVIAALVVRVWQRWQGALVDDLSLAVVLDRFRPGTGQRVADVLQLPELLGEGAPSSSPALVRLAVKHASTALAGSDWRLLWNRRRTAWHAGALIVALLVPAAFSVLAPQAARLSVARWLLGSSERWPQRTYLTVMGLNENGRLLAPRNEPVALEVRADPPLFEGSGDRWIIQGRGEPLVLRRKPAALVAPESVQVRERTAEGTWREGTMAAIAPARYRYDIAPASTSSTFELNGGDDWLGPIPIERVDRPALADVKLRVKEPGTSSGFRAVADPRQHLLFLPDTEVELTLAGNEPLASIQVKVNPGKPPELRRVDSRTFATGWTLHEATTLEIMLTSGQTGLDSRPAFLSIGLLRDREPRVTVRAQGVSSHVTPTATVPLSIGATDDFGLATLRLRIERTMSAPGDDQDRAKDSEKSEPKAQRATVELPLPLASDRPVLDHQVRHDLVLEADPPELGTMIRIVGEAEDRCARGAQTGRSSVLALQVVSPDELFYEILIKQRAERGRFLANLEAQEKETPILDGPRPPSAEDWVRLARLEHASARQLDQIAGRLADTLQEMKLNQVGSPKSHRLLQDGVIDPIRALGAGPVNALRNTVQNAANAGQSSAATQESARRMHHEVVTTMKNILAQMSQWESFVDVVNQVAEVIRMEQKVLQDTEKARESRTKEVFDGKP